MGYHINDIPRGVYGHASKIEEEFAEWQDAIEQGSAIMELVELSDLIGAIDFYLEKQYGLGIGDLLVMQEITKRAFQDGTRKARD